MCGATKRGQTNETQIYQRNNQSNTNIQKITEKQLTWSGHVMRRDEEHTVERELMIDLPGRRRRKDDQKPGGKMPLRDMNTAGLNAVEGWR